jgi:hypothetical protein
MLPAALTSMRTVAENEKARGWIAPPGTFDAGRWTGAAKLLTEDRASWTCEGPEAVCVAAVTAWVEAQVVRERLP